MVSSVLAHVGNDMVQQRGPAARCCRARRSCASATASPTRAPTSPPRARAPCATVTAGASTGRRCSRAWPRSRSGSSSSPARRPTAPKHAGLTFFLVPMSTPGISLQEMRTLPGKRVNITFLDGVHIGDEWRVGDVDGGWQVMLVALSFERGLAGGVRDAERTLRVVEEWAYRTDADGQRPIDDAVARERLVRLAIESEVADLLTGRAAWVAASGGLPGTEGAAAQLFASESFTPRRELGHRPRRARRAGPPHRAAPATSPGSSSSATGSRRAPPSTAAPPRSSATSSHSAASACRAGADAAGRAVAATWRPDFALGTRGRRVPRRGTGVPRRGDGARTDPGAPRPHRPHRLGRGVRARGGAGGRGRRHLSA